MALLPFAPPTEAPPERWTRYARYLAILTIVYNLVEGLVSMGFGWADDSMALFGFGADSFIEVGSALLVLWRLGRGGGCAPAAALQRERRATLGIGALFLLLAVGAGLGALFQLAARHHPDTTLPGLIISLASLAFMAWLWRAKLAAAKALDSRALEGDAACSLACIQLSVVLFAGSLLYLLLPVLWWVDGAATLVLSLLIAREGLGAIRAARQPDFDGGCGCH